MPRSWWKVGLAVVEAYGLRQFRREGLLGFGFKVWGRWGIRVHVILRRKSCLFFALGYCWHTLWRRLPAPTAPPPPPPATPTPLPTTTTTTMTTTARIAATATAAAPSHQHQQQRPQNYDAASTAIAIAAPLPPWEARTTTATMTTPIATGAATRTTKPARCVTPTRSPRQAATGELVFPDNFFFHNF